MLAGMHEAVAQCLERLRPARAARPRHLHVLPPSGAPDHSSADVSAPTLVAAPSARWSRDSASLRGVRLGAWELLECIGSGGFGEVYRARHVAIDGKQAAVKVLSAAAARTLLGEAQATSRARHQHTVDVYDCGVSGPWCYLVTELLEGETLRARLARHPDGLDVPEALTIAGQLARALRAAHSRGVVHLDLKPENVFLVRRDERAVFAKLLDFGIARIVGEPGPVPAGVASGTPGYMAPEQHSAATLDARTDVFGLGVVLHEMLTGAVPCYASLSSPRRRGVGPMLAQLVLSMVAPHSAVRPAGMDEILAALDIAA
jgi:serine/threonine-protein kinase